MMTTSERAAVDIIGVGIGPANLGLAALLAETELSALFFDSKKTFSWHQGVFVAHSDLQMHYLKDLVTPVSPTNPYSFLAFLCHKNRLYAFLHQNKSTVSRKEYEQYYQWVSEQLENVYFQSTVQQVEYEDGLFKVAQHGECHYSQHLAIGVGKTSKIPNFVTPHLSPHVLHSQDFSSHTANSLGKSVCIIGGGQSAAEIIYTLMTQPALLPAEIYWVNKHHRFLPLEASSLSNDYYTPDYCRYFYSLDDHQKTQVNQDLFDTNNGITLSLIDLIYQRAYELHFIEKTPFQLHLLPCHTAFDLSENSGKYRISLYDSFHQKEKMIAADLVIFATGYKRELPSFLKPLLGDLSCDHYPVNADFSLPWAFQETNHIYIQNGADHQFGLADTNLGLFSWRNATIVNSLLNKPHFHVDHRSFLFSKDAL